MIVLKKKGFHLGKVEEILGDFPQAQCLEVEHAAVAGLLYAFADDPLLGALFADGQPQLADELVDAPADALAAGLLGVAPGALASGNLFENVDQGGARFGIYLRRRRLFVGIDQFLAAISNRYSTRKRRLPRSGRRAISRK